MRLAMLEDMDKLLFSKAEGRFSHRWRSLNLLVQIQKTIIRDRNSPFFVADANLKEFRAR